MTRTRVAGVVMSIVVAGCGSNGGGGGRDAGTVEVTVSGTVTFDSVRATYDVGTDEGTLAFADATVKPVRNAVVQLREGATVVASTTTNAQGGYTLSGTSDDPEDLVVAVLARTASPAIEVVDNTSDGAVWGMSRPLPEGATTLDLHATHGWTGTGYDDDDRVAAPFALLDTLYSVTQAFLAVRTVTFPPLTVNWSPDNVPQSGEKEDGFISTSHYDPSEGEIYVLGKAGADTDEFDAHVVAHEWTHYFEDQLARSDSPGGPHTSGDVLDPRIAFGEGLGNAIAAMALAESLYVDTLWNGNALTAFGIDAETAPTPTDDPTPGGFSETTVHRLLYDLFDAGASEAYDGVALGLGPIYDVLVGPQKTTSALTTIASFITGLKAQVGVNGTAVDTLLDHYDIGPITSEWGAGDADLAGIYTPVSLPYSASVTLTGGVDFNKRLQNQYFAFTATGAGVTVSAGNASEDVGVFMYRAGEEVGAADVLLVGTESFSLPATVAGATYVVVVTGFSEDDATYNVALNIQSL